MKSSDDHYTKDLPGIEPARRRGRPPTGRAKSGAQRIREFRDRQKQARYEPEFSREQLIRYVTDIEATLQQQEKTNRKQFVFGMAYGLRMAGYLTDEQNERLRQWLVYL